MPILTGGFSYSCSSAAVGGIAEFYIANQGDITVTYTAATGGNPPSVTMVKAANPALPFKQITFEDDGCSFTEAVEVSNNRVLYKPEYKIKLGHRAAASCGFLDALTGCDRYIIAHVERATNTKWVTGYTATQGMRLLSAATQTGNVVSDENMVEITFGHPTGVQYAAATTSSIPTT